MGEDSRTRRGLDRNDSMNSSLSNSHSASQKTRKGTRGLAPVKTERLNAQIKYTEDTRGIIMYQYWSSLQERLAHASLLSQHGRYEVHLGDINLDGANRPSPRT
jgi:hypothetical protein